MSRRRRITATWRELNKYQKRNRILVYSIIGLFFALGVTGIIFKQFVAGIISIFMASAMIFVIHYLPIWYMNNFYNRAEQEFQKHKDENGNDIYLTGDQMRTLFETGALDMGDSMPNIILEDLFNKKGKDGK